MEFYKMTAQIFISMAGVYVCIKGEFTKFYKSNINALKNVQSLKYNLKNNWNKHIDCLERLIKLFSCRLIKF